MVDTLLPFERGKYKRIVLKTVSTSDKFGKDPAKRSVSELLDKGLVNIDKPSGPTSHQVSHYVKEILHLKKSGHSGTLDPKVTGVLPVALGRATRVVQALLSAGKEYVCLMHVHKVVDEKKVRDTLMKFTGKIEQMPPVKSAVKRRKRFRTVYYIEVLEIVGQDVLFRVGCQAGTYIRKLCLHPTSEIITSDSISKADHFFVHPKQVYTMNKKALQLSNPSEVQRFRFNGKLIKISMSSGIEFLVTPEHRMLISTEKGYIMKQASVLTNGDYIVKSNKYPLQDVELYPADLLDDGYLIDQVNIKELVKKAFIKEYGSIRAMNRKLKLDRKAFLNNAEYAIPLGHIKKAGIFENVKHKIKHFKTEKGSKITLSELNSELLYVIGLIASDGNNTKEKGTKRHTRIKFHNKNKELIDLFEKKYKKIFPNIPISKKRLANGIYQLDSSNSFLATMCAHLGVKSQNKISDIGPILSLNKRLIAAFLKGYLDGDGTVYCKKKTNAKGTYSKISYFTVNKTNAKRIHQMLLKLNISNVIFAKKDSFVIEINDIPAKKRFVEIVGSNHPLKRKRLKSIMKLKSGSLNDNQYVGFHFKEQVRLQQSNLRKLGGNLNRVLSSNVPLTRGFYRRASKITKLPPVDDFHIEKIKKIEEVKYDGFVYDMTVPDTHNFLIETGFVSSNCHDVGTALGVGAHMADLRRTKAGPFKEDTLCTLQDLTDAFVWYQEGDESELKRIIQPMEKAVAHLHQVWVLDSAVDTLCHGASLKVPGVQAVHEGIEFDELIALMTMKGELIGLGRAKMSSNDMQKYDQGVAVKPEHIFMDVNVYPRMER